jgi:hypothetical protein
VAPEALEGAANGGFEDLSHRVVLVHLADGGFEDLSVPVASRTSATGFLITADSGA